MIEESYTQIRDLLYNNLLSSPFTKGISIINFWSLYGRAIIKKTDGSFLYSDFKIFIKEKEIEYYMGFTLLGSISINDSSIMNIEEISRNILNEFVKYIRANYKKMKLR